MNKKIESNRGVDQVIAAIKAYGIDAIISKLFKKEFIFNGDCLEIWSRTGITKYPYIRVREHHMLASRAMWAVHGNRLIPGLVIDHVCRNTRCVNINHLRQTDDFTNVVANSNSASAINYRKTHCIRGHEFDEENTYRIFYNTTSGPSIKRQCKICKSENNKIRMANKKSISPLASS